MIYVGRSLAPITELTRTRRFHGPARYASHGFWEPLPVATPHDELGQLGGKLSTTYFGEWIPPWASLRQFVTDASHELRTPHRGSSRRKRSFCCPKPRTAEEYQKTLAIFDDELKKAHAHG